MLLDKTHRSWLGMTCLLCLVLTVLYLLYAQSAPNGPSGGSWQGLMFGVLGSLCMLYAGLLSGRKALPGARLGSLQFWMKGHIWVGLLSVPLIFFHSGFRFGGPFEQILMVTFLVVIVSGIVGLALQQYLPRIMTVVAPAQAITEQIPVACRRLQETIDTVVDEACGPATRSSDGSIAVGHSPERELREFYNVSLRSFLAAEADRGHPLASRTFAHAQISRLEGSLPERLQPAVREIRTAYEERRQLMAQSRLHFLLHGWLLLHVPLSVALLIFGLVHAIMSVYY